LAQTQTLDMSHDELDLDFTLGSGQAFRWAKCAEGFWTGVVGDQVVRIRQAVRGFEWQTFPHPDNVALIRGYFRLDEDIPSIYVGLSCSDEHLSETIARFRGLRLLRQDPSETLLSFICSAVNSIPRICVAIEELSRVYGKPIGEVSGLRGYSFPAVEALAHADTASLKSTGGLCFRGAALKRAARQILGRPDGWLDSLKALRYEQARAELMTIHGVGRKIADCVCLFALGKDEAVPIDTHVRHLTARLYLPEIAGRSLTPAVCDKIADFYVEKFGPYAGWAQQFLFYEDLLRHRRKD